KTIIFRADAMAEIRQIAAALMFPEGPVALPDGSVLVAMDWPRPGLPLNFLNKQNAHFHLQP
ncbi:MAG: hypothetical protein WBN82_07435, partial [Porticoccaceae bacterium]